MNKREYKVMVYPKRGPYMRPRNVLITDSLQEARDRVYKISDADKERVYIQYVPKG